MVDVVLPGDILNENTSVVVALKVGNVSSSALITDFLTRRDIESASLARISKAAVLRRVCAVPDELLRRHSRHPR